MGLFTKMNEKAIQQWSENLTLEQIEDMEKQGCDMSEYRVLYEERQAEKQRIAESVDLTMLDKYKNTRSVEFLDEVAQFNKISDKKKPQLEQAQLVYGRVVQAHNALFRSDPKNKSGCGIVFLFALDETHRYDEEWLSKTANRISDMKETLKSQPPGTMEKICHLLKLDDNFLFSITIGTKIEKEKAKILPEDCRDFIRTLCLDGGSFGFKLGETLSDGADAWCATYSLWDQSKLPNAQIPHHRIIPFLLTTLPEGLMGIDEAAQLIPPAYYTK